MTDVYSQHDRRSGALGVSEPTSTRVTRSREKMLRAATEILVDAGARGVTVDAVVEASGVAKSTLYRHWCSRDDMLVDVVRCNVPHVDDPDLTGSFEEILTSYLARVGATLADPEWSRIVPALMSLRATMPELAEVVEADRASKTEVLASILEIGVREGVVPPGLDPHDIDKLLFGPLVFAAILGEHERLERLAALVAERFINSYA